MTPRAQFEKFLAKYDPAIVAQARADVRRMRVLVPGSIELVYDNYNALVIGFGPNDKPSLAVFSLVFFPRYVTLCFLQGAALPNPTGRLQGSGNVVRSIRLETSKTLHDPEVVAIINLALNRAKLPINPRQRRVMIIKSISKKQRPRRPPASTSRK